MKYQSISNHTYFFAYYVKPVALKFNNHNSDECEVSFAQEGKHQVSINKYSINKGNVWNHFPNKLITPHNHSYQWRVSSCAHLSITWTWIPDKIFLIFATLKLLEWWGTTKREEKTRSVIGNLPRRYCTQFLVHKYFSKFPSLHFILFMVAQQMI